MIFINEYTDKPVLCDLTKELKIGSHKTGGLFNVKCTVRRYKLSFKIGGH